MMTSDDLVERLALEVEQETTAAVSRRYGFTAPFIVKVLAREAPVSRRLAEAMGFKRVVMFERIEGGRG